MPDLVVKPNKSVGKVLEITPESAGWTYVGFQVYQLNKGDIIQEQTRNQEVCIVLLSGKVTVKTKEYEFHDIGERNNVFEKKPPFSVYIPNDDKYQITAHTNTEIAVCLAPGEGTYKPRLIKPTDVQCEERGFGLMRRKVHNILPEHSDADSLLVVEVFTPEGNWSSYPPHKHDKDNLPYESYLEESYYHKINPEQGFIIQRVYNDNRSLNETMTIENNQAVIVPEGYHPVSVPFGYESYYLNVMAGPVRIWKFHDDLDHQWILNKNK